MVKFTERESKMVVIGAQGRGNGVLLYNGPQFWLENMKKFQG